MNIKTGSSFPNVSTPLSPSSTKSQLNSRVGWFGIAQHMTSLKAAHPCQKKHRKLTVNRIPSQRQFILFSTFKSQESPRVAELDDFKQELQDLLNNDETPTDISGYQIKGALGKPGFISFYGNTKRRKDEILLSNLEKNKNYLLWFIGPTILVASFIFPLLYLRQILSAIFEDSLITDFLILFFTEALFYCGVAVFLVLIDRHRRRTDPISIMTNQTLAPHWGDRISSGVVLIPSLIIPTVTMGFVWPWTGPAASATLAPYLVGIVIQFMFERYARYFNSPSLSAIPLIFQVYRLHQLNRAAQLVTALSFTIRGVEMTSHNQAINRSLSTLLVVLQVLGIICIWSLSSFVMWHLPSPEHNAES